MIYPEEFVNLFKKHGYWRTSLVVFIVMCASIVMTIVYANAVAIINAVWCGMIICSNYMLCMEKEEHELTKATLADTQDDLCISKHEVERLTLELETAQAALVESSAIASAIDVATSEAPLPKPKRKPAPRGTRKPKTKNENKD